MEGGLLAVITYALIPVSHAQTSPNSFDMFEHSTTVTDTRVEQIQLDVIALQFADKDYFIHVTHI